MNVKEVLRSKPVAIGSGVVAFVGAAALAVGLIAMFGRFQAARAVSQYVGQKGQVALIASGGAALGVASVVLVTNIYFNHKKEENKQENTVYVSPNGFVWDQFQPAPKPAPKLEQTVYVSANGVVWDQFSDQ